MRQPKKGVKKIGNWKEMEKLKSGLGKVNWVLEAREVEDHIDHMTKIKKHIKWDVDQEKVDIWFGANPLVEEMDPHSPMPPQIMMQLEENMPIDIAELEEDDKYAASAQLMEAHQEEEQKKRDAENKKLLHKIHPALEDGSCVEYYSAANSTWVPGVVHIAVEKEDDSDGAALLAIYNVALSKGSQLRECVALNALRPQFQQAELVDIFSRRGGGMWAPGSITGATGFSATTVGYRVHVEEQNVVLDKVPPSRLRRRFLSGSAVEVYRGAARGWCPAVVHSAGCQGIPVQSSSQLAGAGPEAPPTDTVIPGDTPATEGDVENPAQATAARSHDLLIAQRWVNVPLYEEAAGQEGRSSAPLPAEPQEWVPSFLVRLRTVRVVSAPGARLLLEF
jgi:hypothetical protein